MKLTKRLLLGLCLAFIFTFLFTLSAFAEAPITEDGSNTPTEEEIQNDSSNDVVNEENKTSNSDTSADTNEDDSFFSLLFEAVNANADNVLSALAFVGSIILAFAYKKGLFPFVERSLVSLGNAVSSLREEVKSNEEAKNTLSSAIDEKLSRTEELITSFKDKIELLQTELGSMEKERCERENMKLIMRTEVDMLFEIIASSSLPQYQKDRANECFLKMKEKLRAGDADDAKS